MNKKNEYIDEFQKTKNEIEKYIEVTSLPTTSKARIFGLLELLNASFHKCLENENEN